MRQIVTEAIRTAFQCDGYRFYRGFPDKMQSSAMQLPALWLAPLEVAGATGRDEGNLTYKVTLYLMAQNQQYTEEQKEERWEELERITRSGYSQIQKHPDVVSADKLTIKPDEFAFTSFGELSQSVTFLVNVYYCHGAE